MSKIITATENGKDVNYVFGDSYLDTYADGFGLSLVGFPSTKLTFVQQRLTDAGENDTKEVVASVTINTSAILEMAEVIKKTMVDNESMIRSSTEKVLALSKK